MLTLICFSLQTSNGALKTPPPDYDQKEPYIPPPDYTPPPTRNHGLRKAGSITPVNT